MSHDSRLFATSSITGVMAILRGGEFLYYPKSEHRNLFMCDVCVRKNATTKLVVVRVPQPKTRPDLIKVDVPC